MENYGQYLSYVLNEDLQKITILFNDNFQINENADYIQVSFLPVANSNEAYQTLLSNIFAELKVWQNEIFKNSIYNRIAGFNNWHCGSNNLKKIV